MIADTLVLLFEKKQCHLKIKIQMTGIYCITIVKGSDKVKHIIIEVMFANQCIVYHNG